MNNLSFTVSDGVATLAIQRSAVSNDFVGDHGDTHFAAVRRPEVPRPAPFAAIFMKPLRQREISRQRLQHMLPGAHRIRIADHERLAANQSPDRIRNQAVL